MRMALPLGISTTMAALNLNMPRYFIHARLGERQLGIYSAMAYATVAMILVSRLIGTLRHPAVVAAVHRGAAGGVSIAAAQTGGRRRQVWDSPAWRWRGSWACGCSPCFYGREYAAHYRIFLVLILATAIHCVASMLTSAVTSARCFRIQVPLYALVVGSNAIGLRTVGAGRGAGRRRRGNGGGGECASRAGRRGRGLAAAGTRRNARRAPRRHRPAWTIGKRAYDI